MKKDYLALWGLLAAAFIIFLGISAFGDEATIGSTTWRTSGTLSRIFGEKQADSLPAAMPDIPASTIALTDSAASLPDSAAAIALSHPESVENQASELADTSQYTVLIIGDSMLDGLAPRLGAYCEASDYRLYSVIWYSSTSEIWGKARLLTKYIQRLHPDFIFICLGSNELSVRDIVRERDKYVKSIIAEIGNIPYVWIGPPNWKEDTGINSLIQQNAAPGRFFLTNGMKFERKKDGAHPTPEAAIGWMDSVARWLPANCTQAPDFSTPTRTKYRPTRQFIHKPGEKP